MQSECWFVVAARMDSLVVSLLFEPAPSLCISPFPPFPLSTVRHSRFLPCGKVTHTLPQTTTSFPSRRGVEWSLAF